MTVKNSIFSVAINR